MKKASYYPRLAFHSIEKNKKLFIPYLIASSLLIAISYILLYLASQNVVVFPAGEETIILMLRFGFVIVVFFSLLFLYYATSYLLKSRLSEFGLYNVLGLSRKNIGKILFWENLYTALFSFGFGLAGGILFSKLAEFLLCKILVLENNFSWTISFSALSIVSVTYLILFVGLYFHSLFILRRKKTIALLQEKNKGEKPAKGSWLAALAGLVLLGGAYYIALRISNPISALEWFFIAVLMVIAATYLLLISGSVFYVRLLQKNKRYYYRKNHFISLSSLASRMKRNGAGLASICILITMVLVTSSTTASLYFGLSGILEARYPRQESLSAVFTDVQSMVQNAPWLQDYTNQLLKDYPEPLEVSRTISILQASTTAMLEEGTFILDPDVNNPLVDFGRLYSIMFRSLSDYNRDMKTSYTVNPGEVYLYTGSSDLMDKLNGVIHFDKDLSFEIKGEIFETSTDLIEANPIKTVVIYLDDFSQLLPLQNHANLFGDSALQNQWAYYFDTDLNEQGQSDLNSWLFDHFSEKMQDQTFINHSRIESLDIEGRVDNTRETLALHGSFFYLGILLSITFVLAAILIIYYKQISEGYEDQSRFATMTKIGLEKRDIQKSIHSQLLFTFFLPLLMAIINTMFAYPVIEKLLYLFNLTDQKLFFAATAITILAFSLLYALVYKLTEKAYYKIVTA